MRRLLKQCSLLGIMLITVTLCDAGSQYARGVKVGTLPANMSSASGLAAGHMNSDLLYALSGSQVLVLERSSAKLVSTVSVLESDDSNWSWDAIAVGACGETYEEECIYLAKQVDSESLRLIRFKVDRELDTEHEMTLSGTNDLILELPAPSTQKKAGLFLVVDQNDDISLILLEGDAYYTYQIKLTMWGGNRRTLLSTDSRRKISLEPDLKLQSISWREDGSVAVQVLGKPNEIFIHYSQSESDSLAEVLEQKGHHIKLRLPKEHTIKSVCYSSGKIYSIVESKQLQYLFLHEPMEYSNYQSDQPSSQQQSRYLTCKDKNKHCPTWAQNDMCLKRKSYMTEYCPASCDSCRERDRMANQPKCVDSNHLCAVWAKHGSCRSGSSQGYMLQNCKKSCKVCSESDSALAMCRDDHERCYGWAQSDRCKTRSDYMHKHCKASCGLCPASSNGKSLQSDQASPLANGGCKDLNEHCISWAEEGNCESRKDYMFLNCPASCSLCGQNKEEGNSLAVCEDSSEYCLIWETYGYCKAKAKYMMVKCPATCQLCRKTPREKLVDKCVDVYESCPAYAAHSMCTLKPAYMKEYCPQSCGRCKTEEISNQILDDTRQSASRVTTTPIPVTTLDYCFDKDSRCSEWRDAGYCTLRPDYMSVYCKESCDLCETGKQTTATSFEKENFPNRLPASTEPTVIEKISKSKEEQPTQKPQVTLTCIDKSSRCSSWADSGYCRLRPEYMSVYCNKSCSYCSSSGKLEQAPSPTTTIQTTTEKKNCRNTHSYCKVWASAGLCTTRPEAMRVTCPASCNVCDDNSRTNSAPTTTAARVIQTSCSDKSSQCSRWQAAGYCTNRELYMRQTCSKSCGFCSQQSTKVKCEDKNTLCAAWSERNRCQLYKNYMERNCPKTCNFCKSESAQLEREYQNENRCEDENDYCSRWAGNGYCSLRADYMSVKCKKSCKLC